MTKNEKLLDKLIDAVLENSMDEAYESADPNRESSYYSNKKVEKLKERFLKKMQ